MKKLLKSWLLLNKDLCYDFKNQGHYLLPLILFFTFSLHSQQIANFVSNGSFEKILDCNNPKIEYKAYYWSGLDSTKFTALLYHSDCGNVPHTGTGYQIPKDGKGFMSVQLYCPQCNNFTRSNIRNRLKTNLIANKTYCVKLFANVVDTCETAVDALGVYFGNSDLDTIHYNARLPLSFLTPQINNPPYNYINDTMNWILITGTFVANGTEKYMVIGNFKSDASTHTISTGVVISPNVVYSEYFVDAISCIEVDLRAYAGPDKSIIPGDSVYVGRENDFAIDKGCIWYKLPNMTAPIDTISGLWVKPTVTTTYVVRQELDCSNTKWDTVVVHMNLVGLEKLKLLSEELKVYPIPAQDFLELNIVNMELFKDFNLISIYNNLGQLIREEEISFKDGKVKIKTENLQEGVYSLQLRSKNAEVIHNRFVIRH